MSSEPRTPGSKRKDSEPENSKQTGKVHGDGIGGDQINGDDAKIGPASDRNDTDGGDYVAQDKGTGDRKAQRLVSDRSEPNIDITENVNVEEDISLEIDPRTEVVSEAENDVPQESAAPGEPRAPMQLPATHVPTFAGQEGILAHLQEALKPGKVTGLWGAAGMGKSAVAVEALRRLTPDGTPPPQFPDGIVWYEFRAQTRMHVVLEHLTRAFGEDPVPDAEESAKRVLQDKTALLVFDGVERAPADLRSIRDISGSCGILLMAREAQSLEGADEIIEIGRLAESDAMAMLQEIAGEWAADDKTGRELIQLLDYRSWSIAMAAEIMRIEEEPAAQFLGSLREAKENPRTIVNQRARDVKARIHSLSGDPRQMLSVIRLFVHDEIDVPAVATALDIPSDEARQTLAELVDSGFLRQVGDHYVADALVYQNAADLQPPDGAAERLAAFRAAAASGLLVDYDADSARGEEDLLDIDQDVDAFAALIASKNVTPPLSIGIFGDWGSGKTFFMRRLQARVDAIARAARSEDVPADEQMQKEIEFYKRIVQVEFNAWHYVEGNLWASLVEHILRNLQIDPGEGTTALENRRNDLLARLKIFREEEERLAERKEELEKELIEKQQQIDKLQADYDQKRDEIDKLSLAVEIDKIFQRELREPLADTLHQFGAGGFYNSAAEMGVALSELRATLQRGNAIIAPLRDTGKTGNRWVLLIILAVLSGPLIGLVVASLNAIAFDNFVLESLMESLAVIGTYVSAAAYLFRKGNSWLAKSIGKVEAAQERLEAAKEEAQQTYEQSVARKRAELHEIQRDYEKARQEREDAVTAIARIEAELEELTPGQALLDYIAERVGSDDYRKHLGIVALIRRDFEIISKSIQQENDWLEGEPIDGHVIESIEDERAKNAARINRIVLYIDDLDRCPPQRVVEVLQAIHLILAFPLFVVVVGVDGRWVSRSLQEHYQSLLGSNAKGSTPEKDILAGRDAGPHDYLEKIFQIPFWLEPLDDQRSRDMLQGLLKQPVTPPAVGFAGQGQPTTGPTPARSTSTEQADGEGAGEPQQEVEQTGAEDEELRSDEPSTILDAPGAPALSGSVPVARQINLTPQALQIEENEALFMGDLAPILSRSPRSLKRFVNTYRLIKAGVAPDKQKSFVAGGGPSSDYQAVMFLLAIVTGLPKISQHFFDLLMQDDLSHADLGTIAVSPDWPALDQEGIRERSQLAEWLKSRTDWQNSSLVTFREWAPHVAQFSFRVENLGRANNGRNRSKAAAAEAAAAATQTVTPSSSP